jgi:hypothetical protein
MDETVQMDPGTMVLNKWLRYAPIGEWEQTTDAIRIQEPEHSRSIHDHYACSRLEGRGGRAWGGREGLK